MCNPHGPYCRPCSTRLRCLCVDYGSPYRVEVFWGPIAPLPRVVVSLPLPPFLLSFQALGLQIVPLRLSPPCAP